MTAQTTTVSAGSSAAVSLAIGATLYVNGSGTAQLMPPVPGGLFQLNTTETAIGPYQFATSVLLVAGAAAIVYSTQLATEPALIEADGSGRVGLVATPLQTLVSGAGITADDTGSAWTLAPALLSISATLTAGTSTTVLLEVRDSVGTVTTALTITADTISQTLRQAFLTREVVDYRFRRSSGTGTVVIYL